MSLLTGELNQKAVYWGTPASDGIAGRTFAEEVEIGVRWEEKAELFVDAQGQERRSEAVVFAAQDLNVGGYLYLGTLDSLSSDEQGDPQVVAAAFEIRQFEKIPDLDASEYVRTAWL